MGDEGDRRAHALLLDLLAREAPGDAVLSEEGRDDLRRLGAERVWIIDPLDGTREFSEPGRTDWAVHVALTIDGVAVAGAVALPARGPHAHHRPAPAAAPADDGELRILVSRTRPPAPGPAGRRRRSAAGSCRWARPAPRPWPSCWARPTSTPTPAASTSGTTPRRPRWPRPPGCTSAASTAARSATTSADPWLPDLLICRPDLAEPVLPRAARLSAHA